MKKNKNYFTNITDIDELNLAKDLLEEMKLDCEFCCEDDEQKKN